MELSSFQYVKKIKYIIISLSSSRAQRKNNILDWADKSSGQSLSQVIVGMKSLLSRDR